MSSNSSPLEHKTPNEKETATAAATVVKPKRFIFTDLDMVHFERSQAKSNLLKLVQAMGQSCATRVDNYTYDPHQKPWAGLSPALACLHGALTELLTWMTTDPHLNPHSSETTTTARRFGNPLFAKWHARLVQASPHIVQAILETHQQISCEEKDPYGPVDAERLQQAVDRGAQAARMTSAWEDSTDSNSVNKDHVTELSAYLCDAFGQPIRLDYGTGHESSFQVFLLALCQVGCFANGPSTTVQSLPPTVPRLQAVTLSLYHAYLKVTRQLQTEYMLEPAGSHGVWGLDDYHCLPFYFGACQLQATSNSDDDEELSKPSCILNSTVLEQHADTYLYLGCIRYIQSLKQGVPFFESSPMLHDIGQSMPTWSRVAAGLLKMYQGEVLDKRQVVQHFVFGNLFAADWMPSPAPREPPVDTTFFGASTKAPWAK